MTRARWVLAAFVVLAGYLLLAEHRAHLARAFPLLIVLVCPLMHVFMHHGHSAHGSSRPES